jgi:hypothetical protein
MLVVEAAVVLVVVEVTIADAGLLTAGVTAGAAALEDGSWSLVPNIAELRCWTLCGGTWLAVGIGADVVVIVVSSETDVVAVGVISAGVVVIVSVAVE